MWQNLLIPGVRDDNVAPATAAIEALGLADESLADPRRADRLHRQRRLQVRGLGHQAPCRRDRRLVRAGVEVDTPLNIHLTGCHHSCAQHYISDIGLIGAKVAVGDEDTVEGYHLFTGGGFGPDADVGQEVFHDLKAEDLPQTVERLLKAYLNHRKSADETFLSFARRHDGATLRKLAAAEVSA